jgi:dual oxidase
MIVREWLHVNHRRVVKIKFGPEPALNIVDRKGQTLRTFDFKDVDSVSIEESQVTL